MAEKILKQKLDEARQQNRRLIVPLMGFPGLNITGGNIKNISLSAAFLAAQDGGSITMENLIWATKREYQKMGKLCTEGDFAQYFELVKG